jgi:hypothetical protein
MVLNWGFLGSGKIARDFACSMLAVEGSEIVSVVRRRAATLLPLPFTRQCHPRWLAGCHPHCHLRSVLSTQRTTRSVASAVQL